MARSRTEDPNMKTDTNFAPEAKEAEYPNMKTDTNFAPEAKEVSYSEQGPIPKICTSCPRSVFNTLIK
jgi:hypothetical protein